MACCKHYRISPECLQICNPNPELRKFIGAMLCGFKFIHIVQACDTGKCIHSQCPLVVKSEVFLQLFVGFFVLNNDWFCSTNTI